MNVASGTVAKVLQILHEEIVPAQCCTEPRLQSRNRSHHRGRSFHLVKVLLVISPFLAFF